MNTGNKNVRREIFSEEQTKTHIKKFETNVPKWGKLKKRKNIQDPQNTHSIKGTCEEEIVVVLQASKCNQ